MANETIITINSVLAWDGASTPGITVDDDCLVTNSSGNKVYFWLEGSTEKSGIKAGGRQQFDQESEAQLYNFANSSTAAAQITLTVTGKGKDDRPV